MMTEVQLPRLQMQAMLGKSRRVAHGKTLSSIPRVTTPRTATSGMLNTSAATNTNNYQSHANTLMVSSGRVSTAVNTQGMRIIQASGSVGAKKRYQSANKYSKSGATLHMT